MLKEDSDVALLRVFEAYLEAAPQQVLQITLLLIDYRKEETHESKYEHSFEYIFNFKTNFLIIVLKYIYI